MSRLVDRLRAEDGFTLAELLIASTLSLLILGATLTTFSSFERRNNDNQVQQEAQDRTRASIDVMARQLRNLASPTKETPDAVDRALPYDFVFRTSDLYDPYKTGSGTNVRRVRYCLDTTNPNDEKLYYMDLPDAAGVPSTNACPGSGWNNVRIVAGNVTNVRNGQDRYLFAYNSTDVKKITLVRSQLFLDLKPGRAPGESRLVSGVFLRNQNEVPVASFTATPNGRGTLLLNASASYDPEGAALTYTWYDGAAKLQNCTGIVVSCNVGSGSHTINLVVSDGATPDQTATWTGTVQ